MNKARRKSLENLFDQLEEISTAVEEVKMEEEYALGNIPENLQTSQRYQDTEENVSDLEDVSAGLSDVCETLQNIIMR